jgi:hypothetical protein
LGGCPCRWWGLDDIAGAALLTCGHCLTAC